MKLEAKLMICKDKLGSKALRDPRTLRELKVGTVEYLVVRDEDILFTK